MRTWTLALALSLAACSGEAPRESNLTQRERDSVLAQSRIPGAHVVGRALRVADSIEAHVRSADTVGQ